MTKIIRVIGVLLWHKGRIVQTERFSITNTIHHDPIHALEAIEMTDLDELIIINISNDQQTKMSFAKSISLYSKKLRIPLSVGGMLESVNDASLYLESGADKLVINRIFRNNPDVVSELVSNFGSSTVVASIDVGYGTEHKGSTKRQIYSHESKRVLPDTLESALKRGQMLQIGEYLFNNVCHDGSREGYDLAGLKNMVQLSEVPVIAFGGVSQWSHLVDALELGVDAVAFGNALHYIEMAPRKAKQFLIDRGYNIRL